MPDWQNTERLSHGGATLSQDNSALNRRRMLVMSLFLFAVCCVVAAYQDLVGNTHYESGVTHFNKREYPQAIEDFKVAVSRTSGKPSRNAHYYLGMCLLHVRDKGQAYKEFQEAHDEALDSGSRTSRGDQRLADRSKEMMDTIKESRGDNVYIPSWLEPGR